MPQSLSSIFGKTLTGSASGVSTSAGDLYVDGVTDADVGRILVIGA